MGFKKTREGNMGILTIPQGTRIYRRSTGGKTFERARKEFDILAMPGRSSADHGWQPAYTLKMRNEFWFVLMGDIPSDEE